MCVQGERIIAERLIAASTRKNIMDEASKSKAKYELSRREERAETLQSSKDAIVSSRRSLLASKLSSANERKQSQLDAKTAKAAAYLATAYERGMQAQKMKESSLVDMETPILATSLSSTKEDKVFDPRDDLIDNLALQWLDDENSVASFSTSGSKTKTQLRLEGYSKSQPTIESLNAKLEAAKTRRDDAMNSAQEKISHTNQAKMSRISEKMQSAELKIKQMSEQFTNRMKSASDRRNKIMEESIRGKAINTNIRIEKAKDRQAEKHADLLALQHKLEEKLTSAQERKDSLLSTKMPFSSKDIRIEKARSKQIEKDARVSEMQQKLEEKLVAALERRESIISAKAAKAAGDVSASSTRGKSALEKKDLMVESLRDKTQTKMDSAKNRRKKLRDLEQKTKEMMMLRRELAKSVDKDEKLALMQKKLQGKLPSAHDGAIDFLDLCFPLFGNPLHKI